MYIQKGLQALILTKTRVRQVLDAIGSISPWNVTGEAVLVCVTAQTAPLDLTTLCQVQSCAVESVSAQAVDLREKFGDSENLSIFGKRFYSRAPQK